MSPLWSLIFLPYSENVGSNEPILLPFSLLHNTGIQLQVRTSKAKKYLAEHISLKSELLRTNPGKKRKLPYVFTPSCIWHEKQRPRCIPFVIDWITNYHASYSVWSVKFPGLDRLVFKINDKLPQVLSDRVWLLIVKFAINCEKWRYSFPHGLFVLPTL